MRVEIKPVSVNECFTGRRWKTEKYQSFVKEFSFKLKPLKLPESPFAIYLKFGLSNKLCDFDNCIKTTVDVLADKYKFNDKLIRRAVIDIEIVEKKKEFIEFEITSLADTSS